jgi:hypothetical protein
MSDVEEAWMIEDAGGAWWTGDGWSRDPNAGIRFARKVDAERVVAALAIGSATATGHMWCP